MRNIKRSYLVVISFMLLGLLIGCGSNAQQTTETENEQDQTNSSDESSSPESYNIASVIALTGGESVIGQELATAIQMGVDDINEAGGINGVPMKLILEDSAADPNRGITAYRKVVDVDKVPYIVSAWSSVINAIAPLAEEDEVLLMGSGAGSPQIKELGDYTWTQTMLMDFDATVMANYAMEELDAKTAAVIRISNESGEASQSFIDRFESIGGEILAFESHAPGATDFSPQLAKIKATNPDVIYSHSLMEETGPMIKQARELGIDAQFLTYNSAIGANTVELAGDAATGLIGTSYINQDDPKLKEYLERWENEQGKTPGALGLTAAYTDAPYVYKALIEKLLEEGKAVNGTNLVSALEELGSMELPLLGKVVFNEDHSVSAKIYINEVQEDGSISTIDTIEP